MKAESVKAVAMLEHGDIIVFDGEACMVWAIDNRGDGEGTSVKVVVAGGPNHRTAREAFYVDDEQDVFVLWDASKDAQLPATDVPDTQPAPPAEKWFHSRYEGSVGFYPPLDDETAPWDGPFDTREMAVGDGHDSYDGDGFAVAPGVKATSDQFTPSVQFIIEAMAANAWDELGECAENYPDVSAEALTKLQAAVDNWARRHVKCDLYIIGKTEWISGEEDAEAKEAPVSG